MTPLSTIAHYRITAKLGEGGMGAVYRATDTKLHRDVAIKVLPDSYARDPDRLARFTREAQVLAGLNHPNIAAIYGVEERALVLELVEGGEPRGPMSPSEALPLIRQFIDALEYAHDKGIVHRDLKPANLKVTPEGNLKILDFGLAKALTSETPAFTPGAANESTLTMRATMAGVIMGTPAYMSPEQARGHSADRRSDIWSFGVIFYELLTGKRCFEAPTVSESLAAVLTRDPGLSAVPPRFHRLLKLCLARDPRERLSHISAARLLLDEPERPAVAVAPRSSRAPWIVAGVALAAAGLAIVASRPPKTAADRPLVQVDLDMGLEVQQPAISPDGARVAFVAHDAQGQHLATRRLDQTSAGALPETEGAMRPFFSPDGRSVGFFAGGKLKRLALDGGAPVVLADAEYPGGGVWGADGTIAAVLGQWTTSIVYRIPSAGGSPQPWTARGRTDEQHAAPHLLPGGRGLLFTSRIWNAGHHRYTLRAALPGKPDSTELLQDASGARHLDGYLVFYRQGKLFAAPFDAQSLKLTGEAIPMVDEVAESEGLPQFDLSSTGTLVYRRGRETGRVVVRVDPSGKVERITPTPGGFITPRFSPDGKRLAVVEISGVQRRILIYDLARGVANRLTLDDRAQIVPAWTPDGRYVIYQSAETMLAVRADGAGQPEPFLTKDERTTLSFSADGKRAVGSRHNIQSNGGEIWIASVENTVKGLRFGTPVTVLASSGVVEEPVFSPDGRFIAYMSNERGTYQVYVISLTPDGKAAGGKWQISSPTGYNPVWPAAGGQVFYDEGISGHIHVVSYTAHGDSFAAAPPRSWSPRQISHYIAKMYDVAADGKHMVAILDDDSAPPETHLRLILNFGDEIRRRLVENAK